MNMATNLAEILVSAVRDGDELVAWAEPNEAALDDPRVEALVLDALGGPVSDDLAIGVPLLRFANTDIDARPLVQAVTYGFRHSTLHCDMCGFSRTKPIQDFLLVPAGASVVSISVCWLCRGTFDHDPRYRSTNLVWS
jgi:hypothetical protein